MGTEKSFEFFEIGVGAAGLRKCFVAFPSRKELLDPIPFAKERLSLWLRLLRRRRSGTVPVDPEFGKARGAIQLIEHPGDFILIGGLWLAAIRHNKGRRDSGPKPRPENRDDQVVRSRIGDLFAIVLVQLGIPVLPKTWA